ncbi:MAG: SAM-dependent methyltransferase [Spirochaetes bacterium]|nr:SAM-dependent methyltransferase [Spirochaetota bacterium]
MNIFNLYPIGTIVRFDSHLEINLLKDYKPALLHLDKFSHVILLWLNNDPGRLLKNLNNKQISGYLSTSNNSSLSPIEISISKIRNTNEEMGTIDIDNIIIPNNAVILDIKPYFPIADRVKSYTIPEKFSSLPAFAPESIPDDILKLLRSGQLSFTKKNGGNISVNQCGHIYKKNGQCRIELTNVRDEFFDRFDSFSHINILWWFNRFEKDRYRRSTQCNPPYENAPRTGIFASRSPVRPNPIGLTTTGIIKINRKKKIIDISPVDAFHNTPVIDVKPYMPHISRIRECKIPQWIDHWGEWFEDDELANSNNSF